MDKNKITSEKDFKNKLSEKLLELFDSVIQERKEYYKTHPNPSLYEIGDIISNYSNKNALISGSINLIPGPWGIAATLPEIVLVIRNQLKMIYDIGASYNKGEILNKEILSGIFLYSMGAGSISLISIKGSKLLVKRVSLRVFQRIVKILGGDITQKLLKSMITKWVPFVGAVAMASWAKYSTHKLGNKAQEILSKDIIFEDNEISDISSFQETTKEQKENNILKLEKIKALINLMKVDGEIHEREKGFIEKIIENEPINDKDKKDLLSKINDMTLYPINYEMFEKNPEEATALIIDLVALAKRDGKFHITEKMYIKQLGKTIGFSEEDLLFLMEENLE